MTVKAILSRKGNDVVTAEPNATLATLWQHLPTASGATDKVTDMVNPGGVTFDLRKFPKNDFERFRNAVLDGKPPAMPPWRDKISDDDLKVLWAYVRSGG